jgi:F-box-like
MQIDARIAALEREIIALKAERNSISPIARLPPEILSRIFIAFAHLGQEPRSVASSSYYSATCVRTVQWSVLTEVSQHWRDVALGCPQLWSRIGFHKSGWAQLMLERSKDAPLYIECALSSFTSI